MSSPLEENCTTSTRNSRIIRLPISQEEYAQTAHKSIRFRVWLDNTYTQYPELFPEQFSTGYLMKDSFVSIKTGLMLRRITVDGIAFSIRPSFVLPHLRKDCDIELASNALLLRKFSVPFWALAHVFGKNPMYWYRLEVSLGSLSLVGTTIKSKELLPTDIAADEKHTKQFGEKVYVATTVADECILGAEVSPSAGTDDLTNAYGVFQQESQSLDQDYQPETVNTDGWNSTVSAFKALFPGIVLLQCFLHIYIKIRDRSKLKYRELFKQVSDKLWNCYEATGKRSFSQRVRRLFDWSIDPENKLPDILKKPIATLKTKIKLFSAAYDHPNAHRTSNMLDRLMQRMDRHLYHCQYFHGALSAANLSIRAWALIYNFAPSNPYTQKKYKEKYGKNFKSPAERLNQKSYHNDWLQNLLISGSLQGLAKPPPLNPL